MVTTKEQAVRIQTARLKAGKRGYAKAVCRYLKREAAKNGNSLGMQFQHFPAQAIRARGKNQSPGETEGSPHPTNV